MARADYFAIEKAIAATIAADPEISEQKIPVTVEADVLTSQPRFVNLRLESRAAPADLQVISASQRTTFRVRYVAECHAFHTDADYLRELRDDLMGRVETVIAKESGKDTKFGRTDIRDIWLDGGEFMMDRASTIHVMGEVAMLVDVQATTT